MRVLVGVFVSLSFMFSSGAAAQEQASLDLLSAYFGLDDALPLGIVRFCLRGTNQDGMPIIFSEVIDAETLDADDFAVTTESGVVHTPLCATLEPATNIGELRTVLLIGEFGDADSDPPARVEVVGEILASNESVAEDEASSFLGASVEVTPLESGPFLVVAESVPAELWSLDQEAGRQQGDGCPLDSTLQIVRVVWSGGVSNAEGDEVGETERTLYSVNLLMEDGSEQVVTPFALADLGDGDNNHLLCLDVEGEPRSVQFPSGHLLDPNRDTLNPDTSVALKRR